jgi:hypothetical protein
VDLDDDIPPALYRVIAELLAWLYRTAAQPKLEIGQELTNCRIDLPEVGIVTTDLVVLSRMMLAST